MKDIARTFIPFYVFARYRKSTAIR
jgi:hypothetical protein